MQALQQRFKNRNTGESQHLFPLDSTIINLTSKLFCQQNVYQVKLALGLDISVGNIGDESIVFGQTNDHKLGNVMIGTIPENTVEIMDRGFASWKLMDDMCENNTLFVVRIKNNMKLKPDNPKVRVIQFFNEEQDVEYRLATNVECMSDEEIKEVYRMRWKIELLWKALKMHLKLDKIITKNENGVRLQIYAVLTGYLLSKLLNITKDRTCQLIDKLRYLQIEISRYCTLISAGQFPAALRRKMQR